MLIQIDPEYVPHEHGYFDKRELFGIEMKQLIKTNQDYSTWLNEIVSKNKTVCYN